MKLRSLKRTLGGGMHGVAAEYFVCDEEEAVLLPTTYDFRDGSTLPVSFTRNLCRRRIHRALALNFRDAPLPLGPLCSDITPLSNPARQSSVSAPVAYRSMARSSLSSPAHVSSSLHPPRPNSTARSSSSLLSSTPMHQKIPLCKRSITRRSMTGT